MFLTLPTRAITTKAGSRAQNSTPGVRSIPGNPPSGRPTQRASRMGWTSYAPNMTATAQPAAMPMSGDQTRQAPETRRARATTATRVTRATTGPAAPGADAGTSLTRPSATGRIVAASSMSTVPDTTGVMIRRSSGSQTDSNR